MLIYICFSCLSEVDQKERIKRVKKINIEREKENKICIWLEDDNISLCQTVKLLDSWGLKYSSIKIGKPEFQLFVDDKTKTAKQFFSVN